MHFYPFDFVFFLGFIIYVGVRAVFEKRTQHVVTTRSRQDRLEKMLFIFVATGSLLMPVLYLFTPLLRFADYELPTYLPWIGTVIMVAALWLFGRSHVDLGLNWSKTLEIRQNHRLIQTGVYRRVRHPMYAAIFLFGLAQGLMLQNWLAGWSALVTFAVMYFFRVPREEQMMYEQFGEEYRAYMHKTGRLLPRMGGKNSARESPDGI